MANNRNSNSNRGGMTVAEAGRKGGDATASTHDRSFYQQIGHIGGQRVRELINKGKDQESGNY